MKKFALIGLVLLVSALTFVSSADTKKISRAPFTVADISVSMMGMPDPVNAGSSLSGNKSVSGGTTPGSTVSYLIQLSNSSSSDQQDNPGNEFTDVLPAGLTLVSADASGGTTTANVGTNTVTWNGMVPATESVTITIAATINNGTVGQTISNQGSISYDADGDGTNEANAVTNTSNFVVVAAVASADVGVTKVGNPETVTPDSDVSYTITITNSGPDTAANVTLNDQLPSDLNFVSLSSPSGWSCTTPTVGTTGTVNCSIASLTVASGAQVFTLVGHVPAATVPNPIDPFITNEATVTSSTGDPDPDDNTATAATLVQTCIPNPIVTTSADSGTGSLRKAISDACTGGTITFDMTPGRVTSPITLTTELVLNKNLTIAGPGASLLTVSGNNSVRVFNIQTGNAVTISDLTIANGKVNGATNGAGVLNSGALTLINCNLYGSSTASRGGGIYSDGQSLTLNNCNVGGAGTGQANNAIFSGAGIFNNSGTLTVTAGSFVGNTAGAQGGGAILVAGGTATINGVNIRQNHAVISFGGGIGSTGGTTTLVNSLIGDNTASGGGALYNNGGTITVVNSTASGNTATGSGGGVRSDSGTLTLTNVTLTNNRSDSDNSGAEPGGGIFRAGGTVTLKNAIVAGNFRGTGSTADDISGTVDAASSFNLIGTGGSGGLGNTNGNQVGVANSLLGVLANNGGPTQTHLLLPGSPAINAGSNALLPADSFDLDGDSNTVETLPVDQRGPGFVRVVNTTVDVGAVEVNYSITATAGTPQSTSVNTAFATALTATVTESGTARSGLSVTFTAPGSGASGTFPGPSATAVVLTDSNGVATAPTFTANGIGGGPYNVIAGLAGGSPSVNFSLTNTKVNQTITFAPLPAKTFGDPDFTVSATASSGLTVTFLASGQCTIAGTTVHLTGPGSCTITAQQAGNATYNAAPDVPQSFTIGKSNQTITFGALANKTFDDPDFTVSATASSGLTVTFLASGQCTIAGTTVHLTAPGSCTITAQQAGNATYNAAPDVPQSFAINGALIALSQSNYNVNEGTGFVTITVNRTGDLSVPVTVNYATDDTGSSNTCSTLNSTLASARCDFGLTLGTLRFAASETQKTFVIPITQDSYTEGVEMFTVNLSNITGASAALASPSSSTVTINDSAAPAPNASDDTDAFVRQHYRDFLNREADAGGLAFWTNEIASGGNNAACKDNKRINVSAAFFLSIEFQETGHLARSFYVASLDRPATNNMPAFVEFQRDTQAMQRGLTVGQGNWQQTLSDNRDAFMKDFVTRSEFTGLYPTTDSPTQYVDKLYLHAAVTPANAQERADTIAEFGSATTAADPGARGRALLRITKNAAFQQREMNRSFVQMQYFGYLRRNPNDAPDGNFDGYNFWLNKLNAAGGDFLKAEMVKAFITSLEYRRRFGP